VRFWWKKRTTQITQYNVDPMSFCTHSTPIVFRRYYVPCQEILTDERNLQIAGNVTCRVSHWGCMSCLTERLCGFYREDVIALVSCMWVEQNCTLMIAQKPCECTETTEQNSEQNLSEWEWRNDLLVNSPLWLTSQITRRGVAAWWLGHTSLVIDHDDSAVPPLWLRGSITKASHWWFAGHQGWRAGSKVTQLGWLHSAVCVCGFYTATSEGDNARWPRPMHELPASTDQDTSNFTKCTLSTEYRWYSFSNTRRNITSVTTAFFNDPFRLSLPSRPLIRLRHTTLYKSVLIDWLVDIKSLQNSGWGIIIKCDEWTRNFIALVLTRYDTMRTALLLIFVVVFSPNCREIIDGLAMSSYAPISQTRWWRRLMDRKWAILLAVFFYAVRMDDLYDNECDE